MPVFISYSHDNEILVEKIAQKLVERNIYVWIDKWELNYGDSLIRKIETAITDCSALLIMLSKSSVESEWCKKELTAGLIRELDEKQVLVIPVVLEECQIPLFLREKYYADFREDFNIEIEKLNDNLLKVTDLSMRRVRDDKYLIDWAIDDGITNNNVMLHIDTVSFQNDLDYSIMCTIKITALSPASTEYINPLSRENAINSMLSDVISIDSKNDLKILLPDSKPKNLKFNLSKGYLIDVYIRRLGNNNTFNILFDFGSILRCIKTVRSIT